MVSTPIEPTWSGGSVRSSDFLGHRQIPQFRTPLIGPKSSCGRRHEAVAILYSHANPHLLEGRFTGLAFGTLEMDAGDSNILAMRACLHGGTAHGLLVLYADRVSAL